MVTYAISIKDTLNIGNGISGIKQIGNSVVLQVYVSLNSIH